MSRPGILQVAITTDTEFALEALAHSEKRSLSGMAALLIDEALRARGVEMATLPRPYERRDRRSRGA